MILVIASTIKTDKRINNDTIISLCPLEAFDLPIPTERLPKITDVS